jgi:hypothetical protein
MSPAADILPAHEVLRALADNLVAASALYRSAWAAHRRAVDCWQAALEGLDNELPPRAAHALSKLNATADGALLLEIDVSEEALEHMGDGAQQLEAVAGAARSLADALEAEEGGLQ